MLDTAGIQTWVQQNIVVLVLMFLGLTILFGAKKKDISGAMSVILVAILGLTLVVGGALYMGLAGNISHVAIKH